MTHLVVVPHTHWDREWYQTHEQFRYRLVELVDELLDLLEGDPGYSHFTLDGQSIVVDDYLAVRPEARERIEKLIRDGRLLVGPWTVLPDEWLVSGEALIRNLRLGLRSSEALGGAMQLGYAPDLFGHVGQLPQIFKGFGFPAAMLWRGVGENVDQTAFDWEAPDGSSLFTVYLPYGYGNAAHLPLDAVALRDRLEREIHQLQKFSVVPSLLLMNGSDHVKPQAGLPAALEATVPQMKGVSFEIGNLPGFVARARAEAPAEIPRHRGELRSGLRAPLLPGCASARMAQKRADFRNDHLLTCHVEPIAAWLGALGGEAGVHVIEHAWRLALENHPHDSICGCSIDAVHDEIDGRLERVAQVARVHLERVGEAFGRLVEVPAHGFGAGAGEPLFVWNPNGTGRTLIDCELELDVPIHRTRIAPFHLRDCSGRRIGARADLVEAGAQLMSFDTNPTGAAFILRSLPPDLAGGMVRGLRHRLEDGVMRIDLRVGSGAGPIDLDGARSAALEALEKAGDVPVKLRARRVPRVRLRFADELPGHGLRVYRLARGPARDADTDLQGAKTDSGGCVIENRFYRVAVSESGRVDIRHKPTGAETRDALRLIDEGDRGDEYNFDPVPEGRVVDRPERVKVRLAHTPDVESTAVIHARYRVPARLSNSRSERSRREVALPATLRLSLGRELDRLDVALELENTAEDHRVRLLVRAPGAADRFEVESAFEVAERPIAPGAGAFGSQRPAERPIGTTPQRSFATLRGQGGALTVANRGGGEVEAVCDAEGSASLALTLVRAVGWLSRGDLALRPGDAGPPLPTPGAQVPGLHHIALSVRYHAQSDAGRSAAAHRFAHPPLAHAAGSAEGGVLHDGDRLLTVESDALQVTAMEPCEGGGVQVRLLHASDHAADHEVGIGLPLGADAVRCVDLRGRADPSVEVHVSAGRVRLSLRPWQIVTLRVG